MKNVNLYDNEEKYSLGVKCAYPSGNPLAKGRGSIGLLFLGVARLFSSPSILAPPLVSLLRRWILYQFPASLNNGLSQISYETKSFMRLMAFIHLLIAGGLVKSKVERILSCWHAGESICVGH